MFALLYPELRYFHFDELLTSRYFPNCVPGQGRTRRSRRFVGASGSPINSDQSTDHPSSVQLRIRGTLPLQEEEEGGVYYWRGEDNPANPRPSPPGLFVWVAAVTSKPGGKWGADTLVLIRYESGTENFATHGGSDIPPAAGTTAVEVMDSVRSYDRRDDTEQGQCQSEAVKEASVSLRVSVQSGGGSLAAQEGARGTPQNGRSLDDREERSGTRAGQFHVRKVLPGMRDEMKPENTTQEHSSQEPTARRSTELNKLTLREIGHPQDAREIDEMKDNPSDGLEVAPIRREQNHGRRPFRTISYLARDLVRYAPSEMTRKERDGIVLNNLLVTEI
ncbi:hypothetical protein DFH07DRAFT_778892 [Mycena maculata]|uniref:Uncharacterized protein n=1 Tax=Mycena maculata TaxID=230809 RepID=A0AAD7IB48_9AGAR|nr:hypothetical protein DFH07DRAFT_778892 [Mycena maculata]